MTNSPGIGHRGCVSCRSVGHLSGAYSASGAVRGHFFTDSGVLGNGANASDAFALQVTVTVHEELFAESANASLHLANARASGNFPVHLVSLSGI